VTDLYAAGEANPTGVTGELRWRAHQRHDPTLDTLYCGDLSLVGELLEQLLDDKRRDLVLGAGTWRPSLLVAGGSDVNAIDALVALGGPRGQRARPLWFAHNVSRGGRLALS